MPKRQLDDDDDDDDDDVPISLPHLPLGLIE